MIQARQRQSTGFTIVELLIVIVVIGILAAITIVAFNGVQQRAAASVLQAELKNAGTIVESFKVDNSDQYPANLSAVGISDTDTVSYQYTYESADNSFCITGISTIEGVPAYYLQQDFGGVPREGACEGHTVPGEPVALNVINMGSQNGCLLRNSTPYCWGLNSWGQIGAGDFNAYSENLALRPVRTDGLLNGLTIQDIQSQNDSTCALADGDVFCWGYNNRGQLGIGATGTAQNLPRAVIGIGQTNGNVVTKIAMPMSSRHACAIASGVAYCWGDNADGRLGIGTADVQATSPTPVVNTGVLAGKTVTDISTNAASTCVIADGAPYCWGLGTSGQLGNGTLVSSNQPVAVDVSGVLAGRTITDLGVGQTHACVLADGLPFCWGAGASGKLGNASIANQSSPVAVVASGALNGVSLESIDIGYYTSCANATSGDRFCWGENNFGILGDETATDRTTPVQVFQGAGFAGYEFEQVTQGLYTTCGKTTDDDFFCWGYAYLGNATTPSNSFVPVPVQYAAS